jgi:hypothetical protein
VAEGALGLRKPVDNLHSELYPIRRLTLQELREPTPVIIGVNWYTNFDRYVTKKDGIVTSHWVGLDANLGSVRGGHCVCLKPPKLTDPTSWWRFYDQGEEGACVGFGSVRAMSLCNRKRYSGNALYRKAQEIDDWDDTPPEEGTSVRAACDVLRTLGAAPVVRGVEEAFSELEGILANRWTSKVEEIAWCLSPDDNGALVLNLGYVTFLNSWGETGYPHLTRMPLEVLQRLLNEDGEATIFTDR